MRYLISSARDKALSRTDASAHRRIHDFVHDERSGCISMEYIDGETLSNLRAEKEQKVFEPDEIAAWTSQLCDALDYAHNRAKIIHCDLKPANLMVNQRGDLKISDFGIARSLSDSVSRLTREQGRSGTPCLYEPATTQWRALYAPGRHLLVRCEHLRIAHEQAAILSSISIARFVSELLLR